MFLGQHTIRRRWHHWRRIGLTPELPLFAEAKRNDPNCALQELADEARGCTRCPLYKNATQTVFGEGPADAHLMLVGDAAEERRP